MSRFWAKAPLALLRHPAVFGAISAASLLVALAAFAIVRGAFFLVFNPGECMLFSSGTTLTHMLLVAIPFAASRLPAKQGILAASAALLLIVNGSFMIGR